MKVKHIKRIVIVFLAAVIGILLLVTGYYFLFNPFSVKYVGANSTYWGDEYYGLQHIDRPLNLDAYGGKLPSDKEEDYRMLVLDFDFTNHSFLKLNEENMIIKDFGECKNRVIDYSNGITADGESFPQRFGTKRLHLALTIYTGGIKKENLEKEIRKIIDSLTVKVISESDWIGERKTTYKVKDNNNQITIKDMPE